MENFIIKNAKWLQWVFIGLIFILMFKSCNSCNSNITRIKTEKQYKHVKDSLDSEIINLCDSIKTYKFRIRLAEEREIGANKRAEAVTQTASAIKTNTTIKISEESSKK